MDELRKKLAELREIGERATPGPWVSDGRELDQHKPHADTGEVDFYPDCHTVIGCDDKRPVDRNEDMEFIATARNNWAGMVEALEIAERTLRRTHKKTIDHSDEILSKEALEKIAKALGGGR